jgi:hypothetical protein
MEFAQIFDRVENAAPAAPIGPAGLTGNWLNSNPDTNGIARLIVSEKEGKVSVQVYAVGSEGLIDWGVTDVALFASTPASRVCAGFTCVYDFGFVETQLQGMIMKGLLVLAQLHHFKDGSGRADYFVREYFALAHE